MGIVLYFEFIGVSAYRDGKKEKNAVEMSRYGMVDEAEAIAFAFET